MKARGEMMVGGGGGGMGSCRPTGGDVVGRDDPIAPNAGGGESSGMGSCRPTGGVDLPQRKRLDHRGPLSIDVTGAWYFITVCAEGHHPWRMDGGDGGMGSCRPTGGVVGRDDPIAPNAAYDAIISTARHFQKIGKWKLALFLVMPDHLHFIVHIPCGGMGSCRPTGLARVIGNFKRSVSRLFTIRFQRDFFDTRLRNDEHYAEKFRYICNNPVRKNLCASARDWPYVIAFNRETGEEIPHRGCKQ